MQYSQLTTGKVNDGGMIVQQCLKVVANGNNTLKIILLRFNNCPKQNTMSKVKIKVDLQKLIKNVYHY